jgi:hypothetical protein
MRRKEVDNPATDAEIAPFLNQIDLVIAAS